MQPNPKKAGGGYPAGPAWGALWGVSAAAGFFYVLMEWVFFATKPSFMSTLGGWERAEILMLAPLPLVGVSAGVSAGLWGVERWVPRARARLAALGAAWPGLVLAAAWFLLLDNVTYTLVRIGAETVEGSWRHAYLLVFAGLWAVGWRMALRGCRGVLAWKRPRRVLSIWAAALGMGWGLLLAAGRADEAGGLPEGESEASAERWPNILILAGDGLSAEQLSLYGYGRDTTPFLREYAEGRALVCENAFANALNSGGSIASLLTGKSPAAVRLYFPPEILTGRAAYEHLPGLLRRHGYWNVDISARHFADAFDLNLRHSFHEANGRREIEAGWAGRAADALGMATGVFLARTWERLAGRLGHAAGLRDAEQVYEQVAGENAGATVEDEPRIDRLLRVIADPESRPFFAHVHLVETHGPHFRLSDPRFSKGQVQREIFETDFYDDAILGFDRACERIVEALERAGELERTVLVLSSDHGMRWGSGRVPLVFWFPGGTHAGRIRANAQNLDIAPTLLEYLGLPVPAWMEGVSLLAGEPPETRPAFYAGVNEGLVQQRTFVVDESRLKPPFFSLGKIGMRVGDRRYELDLTTGGLTQEAVAGHTRPLAETAAPTEKEARRLLLGHLEGFGYSIPKGLRSGKE